MDEPRFGGGTRPASPAVYRLQDEQAAVLSAIVSTADDAIISKTLEGIIISWNEAAERMFGYTEEEVLGENISILLPPDRLPEENLIISNIALGKKVDHFETVRITKSGRRIPISLSVSPIKDLRGNIIGASKIARDITVQKEAERLSRQYTERLELMNAITRALAEELDLPKILQTVIDTTTRLSRAKFGIFFFKSEPGKPDALPPFTMSGIDRVKFEELRLAELNFSEALFSHDAALLDDVRDYPYPLAGLTGSCLTVPVRSRSGAALGWLLFSNNETHQFNSDHLGLIAAVAAQAAISIDNARLYQEVKTLNEKKDEFIGLASHELKTPLTSISAYLQILARVNIDDQGRNFIGKACQQVDRLKELVANLLDISKIESGKLVLRNEPFDMLSIVTDAIELIQQVSPSHSIVLEKSSNDFPVRGDSRRMEQVVINLLSNAIKYSPSATHVRVVITEDANELAVCIEDFGMGIARDKLVDIFTRFYRVDDLHPTISGLGIGLYLSQEIVSRHGGRIWAESEPGGGSRFWFTLPK